MDSKKLPLSPKQTTHEEAGSLTIQNLPPELSQAIWQSSLGKNRVITINWAYKMNENLGDKCIAKDFHATYDKIEALGVSSESRNLALKDYKLCFGNDMRHPIYFNNSKDILRFTSLALAQIIYFSNGDVWNTKSVRSANIKRIAVEMPNDVNILGRPDIIHETSLLRCTILVFATLETIFIQPTFVIDPSSEATFRAEFEKKMAAKQKYIGPLWNGAPYNIPEIVIVCFQCDPNFLKTCQC